MAPQEGWEKTTEFRLLGPVEAWAGQRKLAVGGTQRRALLAMLLLYANRVVDVERLMSVLWGPTPPPTARNSLQVRVSQLRRALAGGQDAAGIERMAQERLIHQPPGYVLRVAPSELDWLRFQDLADQGRQRLAAGDAEGASRILGEALALWRGRALENVDVPALAEHRNRLEQYRLTTLEDRFDADLRLGRHADLIAELEALVAEQPLRERLCAQLMTALYRAGRQTDALTVYRDVRRVLVEDHGLEPGPELQQLEQAILTRAAALAPPAVAPAQLPADLAEFTGRAEALAQLDTLLHAADGQRSTAVAIAVITGTAGVGKTALALHWAHGARARFPDGQLYVDLQGYAPSPPLRPLQALARLLHGLGVEPDRIPVDVETAAAMYRSLLAGRRVLVVLDNARDTGQARPLLPGSPGCMVVITSRDRLAALTATHGTSRLTLDTLGLAEAVTLLKRVLGEDRVRTELDATTDLAELCGRLPLALRIAAANLACHPQWGIAEYVDQLRTGNQLGELAVDGDPHATVGGAFDRSYAALEPAAQRLFRLLGLVPGPEFSTPAAAAVAGESVTQAHRLLEQLAAAHLLETRPHGRVGLHDLLRLYARQRAERLDTALERSAAIERLMAWYLHTADGAVRLLYPEKLRLPAGTPESQANDPAEALAWLDAERANLVAAVQHASAHGPKPGAWLLADALHPYFYGRRHMVDWQAVARAALAAADDEGDAQARAAAHRSLGMACHLCVGDYTRAVEHFSAALAFARQAGWVQGEGAVLSDLSFVYAQLGQLDLAADHYREALTLHRRTGRKAGQATALGNLGNVYRELGRPAQAADQLRQALTLHREIGSQTGQAIALETLGEVHRDLGELDRARECLTEALALSRVLGNRNDEAYELRVLASVEHHAGHPAAALRLGRAALALAREIGERRIEADALNTLGGIRLYLGCPGEAADHHQQALDLAREIGARHPEIEALLGLSAVHQRQNDHREAVDSAEQALALACQVGYRLLQGQAHTALATADLGLDLPQDATMHARQALSIHVAGGHRLGEARALLALGNAHQRSRRPGAAVASWQRALALFTELGSPEGEQVQTLLRASR